ncbi:hypothetical protein [Ideonella sp.]|uniref:hypothetical protein n=1 Tax=Ideonella sp. TaxID=1929293 RepID=UPI0035AE4C66
MFLFKLISAPLLLLAATLAVRRWGESVGGFLVGLPLTSGPISLFLALDHGAPFAQQASSGSLIATGAQAVFCVAYCQLAAFGWPAALVGGTAAFSVVAALLRWMAPAPTALAIVALATMGLALRLMPKTQTRAATVHLPWWDLPARMALIVCLVAALTFVAPRLGPSLSGVLASFPLIGTILAIFAHRSVGAPAAQQVLRGMTAGLYGFVAFFFVLSQALERTGLPAAYGFAVLSALLTQGAWWSWTRRSHRHLQTQARAR